MNCLCRGQEALRRDEIRDAVGRTEQVASARSQSDAEGPHLLPDIILLAACRKGHPRRDEGLPNQPGDGCRRTGLGSAGGSPLTLPRRRVYHTYAETSTGAPIKVAPLGGNHDDARHSMSTPRVRPCRTTEWRWAWAEMGCADTASCRFGACGRLCGRVASDPTARLAPPTVDGRSSRRRRAPTGCSLCHPGRWPSA